MDRRDPSGAQYSVPCASTLEDAVRKDVDRGFLNRTSTWAFDADAGAAPQDMVRCCRCTGTV